MGEKKEIHGMDVLGSKSKELMLSGEFTFSLRGAWVGTVTLYKRYGEDQPFTGEAVDSWSSNTTLRGDEPEGAYYWFKMTAFTSGTARGRLGQ